MFLASNVWLCTSGAEAAEAFKNDTCEAFLFLEDVNAHILGISSHIFIRPIPLRIVCIPSFFMSFEAGEALTSRFLPGGWDGNWQMIS